jgi:hypothetical protein
LPAGQRGVRQRGVRPSGYTFNVTSEPAVQLYVNFLIDLEFVLKAQTCIDLSKKFPGAELLDDCHDGVLIAIPNQFSKELPDFIEQNTKEIGYKLGLKHPMIFEIAATSEEIMARDFR